MRTLSAGALLSVVTLALFACGGGGGGEPGAKSPTGETPSADGGAPATGTGAAGGGGAAATPTKPMKPIFATAMTDDLKKLGLDPKNLPPLNKIEPDKLRQVMKTFTKSMGMKCTGCHEADNFKASTPNKKVTIKMWDEYTRAVSLTDGGAVYCDSCHDGQAKILDRHDMPTLGQYMDAQYVKRLNRVDKKEQSCDSCHGDPFESHIIANWSK